MTDRAAPRIEVDQRYLTKEQARAVMAELGITVTDRLYREIVRQRRLPFFRAVDGRMRIGDRTLRRALAAPQQAALGEAERGAA